VYPEDDLREFQFPDSVMTPNEMISNDLLMWVIICHLLIVGFFSYLMWSSPVLGTIPGAGRASVC
jgi:hypothetical protein